MRQQRIVRIIFAVVCVAALLLTVLSIFDDDFWDKDAFDELFVAVATFIITAALIALATIEPRPQALAGSRLVIRTDPRSPPRA